MARPNPKLPDLSRQDIERFWSKIDIGGPDECWPWVRGHTRRGYGCFTVKGTIKLIASRVAYFLGYGVDPEELYVCHSCDNPPCCNPRHLFLGTTTDNIRDHLSKGGKLGASGAAHGSKTHPEKWRRGDAHHSSTLTSEQVLAMRAKYDAGGVTQAELGREYGISREHARDIINRKRWGHL